MAQTKLFSLKLLISIEEECDTTYISLTPTFISIKIIFFNGHNIINNKER